jgi:anti-sigma factor RsiW
MNDHLTSQQITEYVAGASGPAMEEHVHSCIACRAEAERLSETLALFRDSARRWSLEHESARPLIPVNLGAANNRRVTLRYLGLTAAVAACLIAGLTLPHDKHDKAGKPAPVRHAVSAITDAELLVQVDRELSETVPPSMEPIALTEVKK